ncbi:MAG: hypothetical protein GY858_01205 [Candidatus Omnitrophica bacterium]|nr:hypothetical protein [Candidatus Omnitrophota bacterium]
MKKVVSVIITACVFLVNFAQTALPGSKQSPAYPSRNKQINKNQKPSNLNRNTGKPIPACHQEYGKIDGVQQGYGKVELDGKGGDGNSYRPNPVDGAASGLPTGKRQVFDDGEHGDSLQTGPGMVKMQNLNPAYGKTKISGSSEGGAVPTEEAEPKSQNFQQGYGKVENQGGQTSYDGVDGESHDGSDNLVH